MSGKRQIDGDKCQIMKIVPNDNPEGLKPVMLELPSGFETFQATERVYNGDFLKISANGETVSRTEYNDATHITIESANAGRLIDCVRLEK